MKARNLDVVQSDLKAAEARAVELNGIIKQAEDELRALSGGWSGNGRLWQLRREAIDAAFPVVPREHPGSPGTSEDYVVIKLTAKQAVVRRYGSGDTRDSEITIRATSYCPVVTLDQCRAAWVAAGRELPK